MVHWYNPLQLLKTGMSVLISSALKSHVDRRLIEAMTTEQEVFDYTHRHELWIDFVADLGDGWCSTYAVAYLLAQPELTLRTERGDRYDTKRGDILIMGGDEVYPVASRENYQERLVGPYEAALPETSRPHPHLFALPGNHDWYDGLVSFTRLFCQKEPERWIGGWQLPQTRSYFALRLPHRWWLLGVDTQLETDIDSAQLEYFLKATQCMREGDRVILCVAQPDWIYGNIYDPCLQNNLAYFEQKVIESKGARVVLKLTGDIHHYRRHESEGSETKHLIVAGGGGAFLHPTHGPDVDAIEYGPEGRKVRFSLKAEFPDRKTSRRLAWRNLLFPVWNPWFGVLTGFFYGILYATMPHRLHEFPEFWEAMRHAGEELLRNPSGIVWTLLILGGFVLFTDTHKRAYKWLGGIAHGFAHLAAALVTAWGVSHLTIHWCGMSPGSILHYLTTLVGIYVGGHLVGSFIMGVYLFLSLRVFKRHANEAFSSLRIPDYKNFLRLHIDGEGGLTIYPVGIERVPRYREWIDRDRAGVGCSDARTSPSRFGPKEEEQLRVRLIEDPIRIPPGARSVTETGDDSRSL